MDWLSILGGLSGSMGQGANGNPNPYQVAAPQGGGQQGWGQEAGAMGQQQMGQLQQAQEFGTQGMPPSLQQQLGQTQAEAQNASAMPQANFGQFIDPGAGVLPPRQAAPEAQPIQPMQQTVQAGASAQMPQQQQFAPVQGGQQAQPQTGFGDLFNMTGSAPSSPGNEQGFDPNMFLRMSEGYNRGGLLGALGMLLTDFKQ